MSTHSRSKPSHPTQTEMSEYVGVMEHSYYFLQLPTMPVTGCHSTYWATA